jgi:hypothetical protein
MVSSPQLESRVNALEHKQQELETLLKRITLTPSNNASSFLPSSSPATIPSPIAISTGTTTADKVHICFQWEKEWGVSVGVNWGKATKEQQGRWAAANCDKVVHTPFPPPMPSPMPLDYNYSPSANIIAVCLGATTRKIVNPSLAKLALFKTFFALCGKNSRGRFCLSGVHWL